MNFDRTATIDGAPLIQVRDFLRQWRYFASAFNEAQVAEFFARDRAAARRWLRAACDRGFVEPMGDQYRVAPDGVRLCATKFVPRFDRARADQLVAELLQRTEAAAAARWDYLVEVTGLAVFGSYRDEHAVDLGDIDVLIGTRWLPEIGVAVGNGRLADRCWELFKRDKRAYHRIGDHLDWPDEKLGRFLKARKPRIALHALSDATVIETDVRVIYQLPEGRLALPRDCRPAEFVAAVERLSTNLTQAPANGA